MRPGLHNLAGLGLVALGIWALPSPGRPLRLPPSSQDLLRLSGPLRVLPVPFAWQAFGDAIRRQDDAETLSRGRWLLSLMPEAESLYVGLAWQLAYDFVSAEADPVARARRIQQALLLLEAGMRERPGLLELPALAGFILQDRSKGPGMEAALLKVLGESSYLRASRYMDHAAGLGKLTGSQNFLLQLLSLRLIELEERPFAAQVLETLAKQESGVETRLQMSTLAVALRAEGPLRLTPDLCRWLLKTDPFSRKPKLWPCR